MKTISITANNRPSLLKQTMNSLFQNDLTGYDKLYIGVEPNDPKVIDYLYNQVYSQGRNIIDTELILNKEQLGVRKNPYSLLETVFNDGSEYNVYLEDDILLSPDAFQLANFFYDLSPDDLFAACSFYHYLDIDENRREVVSYWQNLVAIAFSLTKYSWEKYFKPYWFDDRIASEQNIGGYGWDWSIRAVIKKFDLKVATPIVPRVTHTGVVGTFCSPMAHRKIFGNRPYNLESVDKFVLEGIDMDRIRGMRIYQNCYSKRICDVLNEEGFKEGSRIGIVFNHGLGDYILFLPVFEELIKRYPQFDFYICSIPEKDFLKLHEKAKVLEPPYGQYGQFFDALFNIQYPEVPRTNNLISYFKKYGILDLVDISKPIFCNKLEVGLEDFEWTPPKINIKTSKKTNKVGFHFAGFNAPHGKDVPNSLVSNIWDEIFSSGFDPIECNLVPINKIDSVEKFNFISSNNSIRFESPNLKTLVETIADCKYFIGVDSGPLYLAGAILGFDKVIGLEGYREFDKVLPIKIQTISLIDYENGSVMRTLSNMED